MILLCAINFSFFMSMLYQYHVRLKRFGILESNWAYFLKEFSLEEIVHGVSILACIMPLLDAIIFFGYNFLFGPLYAFMVFGNPIGAIKSYTLSVYLFFIKALSCSSVFSTLLPGFYEFGIIQGLLCHLAILVYANMPFHVSMLVAYGQSLNWGVK